MISVYLLLDHLFVTIVIVYVKMNATKYGT